jgi:predicted phage tail protein
MINLSSEVTLALLRLNDSLKPTIICINNKENIMKTKDAYIESLAAELKEWSAQIDTLTLKAEDAAAQGKQKYLEEVQALRAKQVIAAEKIQELNDASAGAWATVKETADKVWDDLRTGLATAAAKF